MADVTDEQLRDAINLIAEYATSRLPEDWEITLTLRKDESDLTLFDPEGQMVYVDGENGLRDYVEMAIEEEGANG